MPVKLNSSGGGSITLDTPSTASARTLTLADATSNIPVMQKGTAQASTSGTSIDFTGLPAWVDRITVMFTGVSVDAATDIIVQIGTSSGVETTGYTGASSLTAAAVATVALSSGWRFYDNAAAATNTLYGALTLTLITGTTWSGVGIMGDAVEIVTRSTAGTKTLASTLGRVRVTTVSGTANFDAGTINILYEGY